MRRVAVVVATAVLLVRPVPAGADPSTARHPVAYLPPVPGPVVDPYRPPPHPWDAGNRGVDYSTVTGAPVGAAADGEVVFAGSVAGTLHVVVLHADGIRTSYSFLRSVAVHRGDRVRQGQTVGTSGDRLHFGARAGDDYIDPTSLFGGGPPRVHLVPDEERRAGTEAHERRGLLSSLLGLGARAAGATAGGLAWVGDRASAAAARAAPEALGRLATRVEELRGLLVWAKDLDPQRLALGQLRAMGDWYRQRHHCTPAGVSPPPLATRHIAVKVAGLGSTSDNDAGIDGVDTAALGYAEGDVVRFSYGGGTVGDTPYDGRTTTQDIRVSARRLRALLEQIGRENPGVPVDILAHSEGGIVARRALAYERDAGDPRLPPINSVVLLGAPNQGADLATTAVMLGHTGAGLAAGKGAAAALPDRADLTGPAIHQLAETSLLLARLNRTPPPPGVHVTSIGARTDPIVPGRRTRLEGADNIVLDAGAAWGAHDNLPASRQALREVGLAIAGLPPTCQSLADMLEDERISQAVTIVEDSAGAASWLANRWVDVP